MVTDISVLNHRIFDKDGRVGIEIEYHERYYIDKQKVRDLWKTLKWELGFVYEDDIKENSFNPGHRAIYKFQKELGL